MGHDPGQTPDLGPDDRETCPHRQGTGRPIATAEEARKILKIGVTYNSVEETLRNLGLPPNREGDQKGFIGYTTSGGKVMPARAGGSDGHPLAGDYLGEFKHEKAKQ